MSIFSDFLRDVFSLTPPENEDESKAASDYLDEALTGTDPIPSEPPDWYDGPSIDDYDPDPS